MTWQDFTCLLSKDRSLPDRRRLLRVPLTRLEMHAQRHGKTTLLEKVFQILHEVRKEAAGIPDQAYLLTYRSPSPREKMEGSAVFPQ